MPMFMRGQRKNRSTASVYVDLWGLRTLVAENELEAGVMDGGRRQILGATDHNNIIEHM